MAIQSFNSLGGYSVSETANLVIDANANVFVNDISCANITGTSNVEGANLVITSGGNLWLGGTPFVRTLTVGSRVGGVTIPMSSNNSFTIPLAHGGNAVVITT